MNKIIFYLASIIAAVTFASEASALPSFARQTGMECSACHFQHFPLLTAFGRSFKANGFTMIGAQGKVEGDRLSLPNTLNMAVLTSFGYEKTNQTADNSGVTKNTGNGVWFYPGAGGPASDGEATSGELSLFFGGRVSDNAGFLSEIGLGGNAAAEGSAKLPILFEVVDGTRVGIVPFATDAQGASYGMELLNTGANAVQQMSNTPGFNSAHTNAMSAQQYINTAGTADGFAFVVTNPGYFVNLTKFQQTGISGGAAASLGSTYARAAYIFDLAGWDSGVGIQNWSGQSLTTSLVAPLGATKATAIDGQMQGELNKMPVGFYLSYAKAPAVIDAFGNNTNTYSNVVGGLLDRSSFNISGEVGVLPGIATLGVAIRRGKSGFADTSGANTTDNAFMLTATYKVAQNMLARITYTADSGNFWDEPSPTPGLTNSQLFGNRTTTINVYTLF